MSKFRRTSSVSALAAFALASCGGGGDSSAPKPNSSPRFTSASSATVAENTSGVVYQATASDVNADSLSYSISGGADAAAFTITAAGGLSFVNNPDFEAPSDANQNNIYDVNISVSDGKSSTTLTVSIAVSNLADAAKLTRIATGMGAVVSMSPLLDESQLIISNAEGRVFEIDTTNATLTDTGLIFVDNVFLAGATLLSAAPEGQYGQTKFIYAMFRTTDNRIGISSFNKQFDIWSLGESVGQFEEPIDDDSVVNASSIAAPDGSVYFLANDGGFPDRAQKDRILGNIVRAFRNPDPYAGASIKFHLNSIVARGLHWPTGAGLIDGDLIFSDAGENGTDEINIFDLTATMANFGWPFKEGLTVLSDTSASLTDPVLTVDRNSAGNEFARIIAGQSYDGPIVNLDGKYLFASQDGRFWTLPVDGLATGSSSFNNAVEVSSEFKPDVGTLDAIVAISKANDRLYILDEDGDLYRVDLETV